MALRGIARSCAMGKPPAAAGAPSPLQRFLNFRPPPQGPGSLGRTFFVMIRGFPDVAARARVRQRRCPAWPESRGRSSNI